MRGGEESDDGAGERCSIQECVRTRERLQNDMSTAGISLDKKGIKPKRQAVSSPGDPLVIESLSEKVWHGLLHFIYEPLCTGPVYQTRCSTLWALDAPVLASANSTSADDTWNDMWVKRWVKRRKLTTRAASKRRAAAHASFSRMSNCFSRLGDKRGQTLSMAAPKRPSGAATTNRDRQNQHRYPERNGKV